MSPSLAPMTASFVLVLAAAITWIVARPGSKSEKWALVAAVACLLAFFGCAGTLVHGVAEARRDAVKVIERTHDITIDKRGRFSEFPSDWKIDGIWRTCYLSDSDLDKIEDADLMCDTPVNGQPPYTKIGATE